MKKHCLHTMLAAGLVCGANLFAADEAAVPPALPGMTPPSKAPAGNFSWDMVPEIVAKAGDKSITREQLKTLVTEHMGEIPAEAPADQIMLLLGMVTSQLNALEVVNQAMAAQGLGDAETAARELMKKNLDRLPEEQRSLLEKQLAEQGETLDSVIDKAVKDPRMQIQAGILTIGAKLNADKPAITEEDAKKFYEENKNLFTSEPGGVKVSHILLQVKDDDEDAVKARIAAIREEVAADTSKFADTAKAQSDCPSKAEGGALGMTLNEATGNIDPDFLDAALKLEVGEVSPVVKTRFGYHVILCTEKTEAKVEPWSDGLAKDIMENMTMDRDFQAGDQFMSEFAKDIPQEIAIELPRMVMPQPAN